MWLTHKAVALVAVEALRICARVSVDFSSSSVEVQRTLLDDRNVLLSGNHLSIVSDHSGSTFVVYALCLAVGVSGQYAGLDLSKPASLAFSY